ncbi:hypothetical protein BgiMline_010218 [Biomphalaria glabrata]|nr:hypothetical protein BgiMline_023953 [Biomphalaria glabrata]
MQNMATVGVREKIVTSKKFRPEPIMANLWDGGRLTHLVQVQTDHGGQFYEIISSLESLRPVRPGIPSVETRKGKQRRILASKRQFMGHFLILEQTDGSGLQRKKNRQTSKER